MKWADRLNDTQFRLMTILAGVFGLLSLIIIGHRLDTIRGERMKTWFAEHGYESPSRLRSSNRSCDEWLVTSKDGGTVHRFRDCRRGDPELVW